MTEIVSVDLGDIEKKIKQTIADIDGRIRRKAGKTVGQKVGEALEANTPVDVTTNKMLLEEAVVVGAVQDDGTVDIGYSREAYFRAHFANMGTEYQDGQHFIERTVEEEAEVAMRDYMSEIKKGLNL